MLEEIIIHNKRNKSVSNCLKNRNLIIFEEKLIEKRRNSFIKTILKKSFEEESLKKSNIKTTLKIKEDELYLKKINKEINIIKNIEIKTNSFELIGIRNIGNSCYMNSVLQILFRTPGFLDNLKSYYNSQNYTEDTLIKSLIYLSKNPKSKSALKNIKKEMAMVDKSYGKFVQNDSQMFAIDLIEQIIISMKGDKSVGSLEDEIKQTIEEKYKNFIINSKLELNPFENMFLFHESFFKINEKKVYDDGFESWLNINLTFPETKGYYSIEELLEIKYLNHEKMKELSKNSEYQGKNSDTLEQSLKEKYQSLDKYSSIRTNSTKNIEKNEDNYQDIYDKITSFTDYIYLKFQMFIETLKSIWDKMFPNEKTKYKGNVSKCEIRQFASLPNVLIISINRAILGKKFHLNKLKFNKYLNLNHFLDEIIFKDNSEGKYKLYAVNECQSFYMSRGHYISYIETSDDKWYKFDDEIISLEKPNFSENRYVVGLYYIKA